MQNPDEIPRKVTGIRHLFAAQRYSASGARRLWQEAAFRHECLAMLASVVFFAIIGASVARFLILIGVFLIVVALEALNTAIEEIIDRISPEFSATGRHAKDLGSFAVFCGLLAWGILMLDTTVRVIVG
ncbi:diacylglycerol kinase [Rhizobium rhizoryzae]|jgi:diacylglycerol kinase (ATP)|uniref:diacylglycerol kinase n=1 Tax=Rhizobium rhizoryzae TaxID=451876 RepID=UPI00289721AC|nr:diacylglycerol kinase [Rhizobium rhizoryzae]